MAKKKTKKKPVKRKQPKSQSHKRKTVAERVADIDIEDFVKLDTSPQSLKTLSNALNALRRGYRDRLKKIHAFGEYSYAEDAFKKSLPINLPASKIVPKAAPDQRRNLLISEISKFQSFMKSETSTVEGIKNVQRQQDIMVFGRDESGNPLGTMTADERLAYWSAWDEYSRQFKEDVAAAGRYIKAMQVLHSVMFQTPESQKDEDFNILLNLVNEARMESGFSQLNPDEVDWYTLENLASEFEVDMPTYMGYAPGTGLYSIYKANYKYHH